MPALAYRGGVTDTVSALELPERGFLRTRRGSIVEVELSHEPIGPQRLYLRVPEGAGEIPAGIHSTEVAAFVDDDQEDGWLLAVALVPEQPGATVRRDAVFDARWDWDDSELVLAEHRVDLEPEPAPDRECEADPFGMWALDERGRALIVEGGIDDDTGLLWLQPVTPFGGAMHPGIYDAVPVDEADAVAVDEDDAMVAGDAAQQVQLYLFDGYPDEPYERWTIGRRAAVEAAAAHPLPDFDPTDWMRWLTPADGGDPVPVVVEPADGAITFQLLGSKPPAWAQGRVVSAPLPRGGQSHADRREVQLTAKPVAELRSSAAKMRKRPPARVGRFVLEAQGFMPPDWARFG